MPDYRIVKNAATLKGQPVAGDHEVVASGEETNVGLDVGEGKPAAQLNIRYRPNATYVSLMVDDGTGKRVASEHWRFKGHVSPDDCRANWQTAQRAGA